MPAALGSALTPSASMQASRVAISMDLATRQKGAPFTQPAPQACSGYKCFWLSGLMPSEFRPRDSGILITPYQVSDGAALTIMVFDPALACEGKKINQVIQQCMMMPLITELRIVYPHARAALYLRGGKVYQCRIIAPTKDDKYESLRFEASGEPIAHYLTLTE